MLDLLGLKRIIRPLIKGFPFIVLFVFAAYLLAERSILYMVSNYEATAMVKLDDSNWGLENFGIFKNMEKFATGNKVATEVSILKSEIVINKAVEKLLRFNSAYNLRWFRKGKIKKTELHGNKNPFTTQYQLYNSDLQDQQFWLKTLNSDSAILFIPGKTNDSVSIKIGDWYKNKDLKIKLSTNETWLKSNNKNALKGNYYFEIQSKEKLVEEIKTKLDIVAKDKDIPIVTIIYKDEIAERTALIANTMLAVYIDDQVSSKTKIAVKTNEFIDARLSEVKAKLFEANTQLKSFKESNSISNFKIEVTENLKQLNQLQNKKADKLIQINVLENLVEYLNNAQYEVLNIAPQVGFGDLLLTEIFKNLYSLNEQKANLLLKYTEKHEKVVYLKAQITQTSNLANSAIRNSLQKLKTELIGIEQQIETQNAKLKIIPKQEQSLDIAERNASQLQKQYDYLKEKLDESGIIAAAGISFHRILQKASVPKKPISPNKTLIYFASIFLALVTAIALVYIFAIINPKVLSIDDIERNSLLPIWSIIPKPKRKTFEKAIANLAFQLLNHPTKNLSQSILFTSLNKNGNKNIVKPLALALGKMTKRVLIIDFKIKNASEKEIPNGVFEWINENEKIEQLAWRMENSYYYLPVGKKTNMYLAGDDMFKNAIEKLKTQFDFIIIDSNSIMDAAELKPLSQLSDKIIISLKHSKTKLRDLAIADLIKLQNPKKEIAWVYTNYNRKKHLRWNVSSELKTMLEKLNHVN